MYLNNYLAFFGAIRAKYPHMRLIANCDMGQDAPTGGAAGSAETGRSAHLLPSGAATLCSCGRAAAVRWTSPAAAPCSQ